MGADQRPFRPHHLRHPVHHRHRGGLRDAEEAEPPPGADGLPALVAPGGAHRLQHRPQRLELRGRRFRSASGLSQRPPGRRRTRFTPRAAAPRRLREMGGRRDGICGPGSGICGPGSGICGPRSGICGPGAALPSLLPSGRCAPFGPARFRPAEQRGSPGRPSRPSVHFMDRGRRSRGAPGLRGGTPRSALRSAELPRQSSGAVPEGPSGRIKARPPRSVPFRSVSRRAALKRPHSAGAGHARRPRPIRAVVLRQC